MNETTRELFQTIIRDYINQVRDELFNRLDNWSSDFKEQEKYEVVGAILARQVNLAVELAMAPITWNPVIGPLVLRAMTDNYINLAWIFGDPFERSRQFIAYGLGQEKLQIEHLRAEISTAKKDPDTNEEVKVRTAWLDSQRYIFLTEVTVGSWSGLDARKMAEAAGCIDLYNYRFQPLSSATHSTWNYIAKYNLKTCPNPLHKFHRIPIMPNYGNDLDILLFAADLVQMAFDKFDSETANESIPASANQELLMKLEETGNSLDLDSVKEENNLPKAEDIPIS